MADKRKNNGGARDGAGRKPKADEIAKIEMMDSVGAPVEAWQALWYKVQDGDTQAIKCWVEHRFGRPKEQKEHSHSFIDIKPIEWIKSTDEAE